MPPTVPPGAPGWTVLLIGGASGTGKTTVAAEIGRLLGIPWMSADDLRLALHHGRLLTEGHRATLAHFDAPDVWSQPPEQLRDALVAIGRTMEAALAIVVANHVATASPLVLEGDAVLPSLLSHPGVATRAEAGRVRAVFLDEPDAGSLLGRISARGRTSAAGDRSALAVESQATWLFGRWLAEEARRAGLPVVPAAPASTLAERILDAAGPR